MIPLLVRVLGAAAADDVNPGWDGHVSADEAFVALLVAETPSTLHWAKAEPAAPSGLPLSVRCHPLADPSLFQFMFILGFGWITSLKGTSAAKPVRPRLAIPDQLPTGRLVTIATVESSPPISAGLLVLARSDVSVGRNRIWRPHKALFRELPNALHPALSGSRNGSYEVNRAS